MLQWQISDYCLIKHQLSNFAAIFWSDDNDVCFVLNQHAESDVWVDMSLHSEALFWFRASQSLLFLLSAACLAEKQQIPTIYSLWVSRSELALTISSTRIEHANHYTGITDTVVMTEGYQKAKTYT